MKSITSNFQFKLVPSILLMGLVQIIIGSSFVFSSTLFSQLQGPKSLITLSNEETSWIASVPTLICPVGLVIVGVLADKFGRRVSFQLSFIPLILSWLILACANSYETILIGRIILGFSFGSCSCVLYVYLAEICPAERRPFFNSLMSMFIGVGNIVESSMALFFDWHTISLILAVAAMAICTSMFFVSESPMWLRAHDRIVEAEAAEQWFGLDASRDAGEPCGGGGGGDAAAAHGGPHWWSLYARPVVWKPTLITLGFFVCETCSGVLILMFYTTTVLNDCRVTWDNGAVTVLLYSTRVVSSVIYASLHWVRRKTLAVASCAGMTASLLVIVVYMKAYEDDENPPYGIVPIVAFAVYVFAAQIGILPMPKSLCGEVFPMAVKGTMNGVVQTCGYMFMFAVIKIYPMMVSTLGIQEIWTIFTIMCMLSVFFCSFILPETKGVTLDVILTYFEPPKKNTGTILPK